MTIKRIHNAIVVRFDAEGRPEQLADHDILIDGAWIKSVHPTGDAPPELPEPEEDFDAADHIVLPGLVNCHQHLFQSLTRAHRPVQNAKLFTWLTTLYNVWAKYGYEELRLAATVALAEMMLSGVTCTTDMHYLFPKSSDLRMEAIFEAAETLGIRIVAGRGCMTLGKSRGGLPPDEVCESDDVALADAQRVLETFHDPAPGAMWQVSLQPCAPFNVTLDVMKEMRDLAREHGAVLQTHLAETDDETEYCEEKYGCRPLALMERLEWLGEDISFAHCVTLDEAEVRLLAETGTGVAHCPSANMRLGSGTARVWNMVREGVTVGIGVDGSSSNDGMGMLAEGRLALLAQRTKHGAGALLVEDAVRLCTAGGAKLLRRPELGNIAPGCAADLALWDLNITELAGGAAQDPLGSLFLCQPGRAEHVMVNGQWTVRQRNIASIDMYEVVREANRLVRTKLREPVPAMAKQYPPVA